MTREHELSVRGKVRIKTGPFQSFTGTITEIDRVRGLVKVKIDIFGRPESVKFKTSDVAAEE